MSDAATRASALDYVVVVLFENRSLDNMLGHLYGPEDGKTFEGVIGKDLSNPIPEWADHGAERKVVPYTVATDMDSPNPDSGEEWYHTNTQLFGVLDEHNRFKIGESVTEPWNAPPAGATPTMDGFVADYISTFTAEVGRQPTYEEYAQIMTGYTPEQVPVLSAIARDFGVFDHWFSEVPSQTFMNRSFWTAATSSGLVVNSPAKKWFTANDAETIFERLEQRGKTWKVYVQSMPLSFHGVIHASRMQDRLATNFVPFAEFEHDAVAGTLPDFAFIEPNMLTGHSDYHPAAGRSFLGDDQDLAIDTPSSVLGGEDFLARVYNAYRSATARTFDHLFTRETPRDPDSWTAVAPQLVPDWAVDYNLVDKALSGLGKTIGPGVIEHAKERGVKNLPPELDDPNVELTPRLIIQVIRDVAWHYFPKLAPGGEAH